MKKAAAASLAVATVLTLTLAGCGSDSKGKAERDEFGQIGTGATERGTAGGGTRTTNEGTINSGSYGELPAFARNQQTTGTVAPITGPGFATAPAVGEGSTASTTETDQATTSGEAVGAGAMAAALVPVPQGAVGSAVRDHSFPANPNSPAQGGYYRPNSEPTTSVGPILPPFDAAPEYRAIPVDVPQRDTQHTVSGEH